MQFYELVFSQYTRFNVVDVEDYHVKGSFDPAASCDTEFFGYRETTFKVESAEGKDAIGYWPLDESELEYFLKHNDDKLTLIVQDAIDKQNGDV